MFVSKADLHTLNGKEPCIYNKQNMPSFFAKVFDVNTLTSCRINNTVVLFGDDSDSKGCNFLGMANNLKHLL